MNPNSYPTAQELIELKGVDSATAEAIVRDLLESGYLAPPAVGVFQGERPEPGDRIRVVRTKRKVHEGFWKPGDEEDRQTPSGHSGIVVEVDGTWMRLRDQGPVDWGDSGNGYTEADTIEVLERRNGAPYRDLCGDWFELNKPAPKPRSAFAKRLLSLFK